MTIMEDKRVLTIASHVCMRVLSFSLSLLPPLLVLCFWGLMGVSVFVLFCLGCFWVSQLTNIIMIITAIAVAMGSKLTVTFSDTSVIQ